MATDLITTADPKSSQVRIKSNGPWTTTEYGQHLFSMGGSLFGSQTNMYKLAVSAMCVDVLSQDASKAPLKLYAKSDKGRVEVKSKDHPVAALLTHGPNPIMGPKEFVRMLVANLAISNESYIPVRRNGKNEVLEFTSIQPKNVSKLIVPEARRWVYQIKSHSMHEQALFGWADGELGMRDCAHIKTRSLNGYDVVANAAMLSGVLKVMSDMQGFLGGSYENGGLPQLAFSFPDELTEEQFKRLEDGLKRAVSKAQKSGTPIILEGNGTDLPKVENLSQTAGDKDFMSSMSKVGMDTARYFRVPPHKLYLLENVKYSNVESLERSYVHETLFGIFDAIEEGLNRVLLTSEERDDYEVAFDREKAYTVIPETHQKIVRERWISGMITQDQMLSSIGQNPVGGEAGEYRLFGGGNYVMVDKDFKSVMVAGGGDQDTSDDDDDKPADDGDEE